MGCGGMVELEHIVIVRLYRAGPEHGAHDAWWREHRLYYHVSKNELVKLGVREDIAETIASDFAVEVTMELKVDRTSRYWIAWGPTWEEIELQGDKENVIKALELIAKYMREYDDFYMLDEFLKKLSETLDVNPDDGVLEYYDNAYIIYAEGYEVREKFIEYFSNPVN